MTLASSLNPVSYTHLLCETTLDKVLANMDKIDNDRAILRAIHFFKENERVERAAKAVEEKDGKTVLKLLSESGKFCLLYTSRCV